LYLVLRGVRRQQKARRSFSSPVLPSAHCPLLSTVQLHQQAGASSEVWKIRRRAEKYRAIGHSTGLWSLHFPATPPGQAISSIRILVSFCPPPLESYRPFNIIQSASGIRFDALRPHLTTTTTTPFALFTSERSPNAYRDERAQLDTFQDPGPPTAWTIAGRPLKAGSCPALRTRSHDSFRTS
jgi:hypothetical protein